MYVLHRYVGVGTYIFLKNYEEKSEATVARNGHQVHIQGTSTRGLDVVTSRSSTRFRPFNW